MRRIRERRLIGGTGSLVQAAAAVAPPPSFGPTDLLTTVTAATCQIMLSGDLGFSSSGGTTTWADQSSNGRNLSIADASAPTQSAFAEINNRNAIAGNGSSQYIESAAFNRGATWWYLFVMMPRSWTSGDSLMDSTAVLSRHRICQNPTAHPNWRLQGTGNGATNAGGADDAWYRVRASFTGGTAAYLRIAATNATGADPGSAANTGMRLFAGGGGTPVGYFDGVIAFMAAWDVEPTADLAAIDTWVTGYYGAAVGVG